MTDVPPRAVDGEERALMRPLIYDQMDSQRLAVIRDKVSRGYNVLAPTDSELAVALEIADKYDLDFLAGEVWLVKSKGKDGRDGQLLLMVARDGLRKIARRNSLDIDSDVVREKDVFKVRRTVIDGKRVRYVEHSYEGASEEARGRIIGAWCEVWERSSGQQMGYNFAPLEEYIPTNENKLRFSPWGTQVSIMILTAAERNALRQATPLSGLLGEGEMDLNDQVAAGEAAGALSAAGVEAINAVLEKVACPDDFREELRAAIYALNAAEPNAYGPARIQMSLLGQDEATLMRERDLIERETREALARRADAEEERSITDAEVVPS